jgi:hypothetical protein
LHAHMIVADQRVSNDGSVFGRIGQLGLQGRLQCRQVFLYDLPNAVKLYVLICVRSDIPEAIDLPPRNARVPRLQPIRKAMCRIGKRLDPPQDRILDHRVAKKCGLIAR